MLHDYSEDISCATKSYPFEMGYHVIHRLLKALHINALAVSVACCLLTDKLEAISRLADFRGMFLGDLKLKALTK